MRLLRFLRWTLIFLICLITGRAGVTNAQTTCPLSPRLTTGQQGKVLGTTPNHLRELPTLTGAITGAVPGGSVFDVLAGPECDPASGYNWWQVAYAGQVGWTAEGDATTYFLEPINPVLSAPGAGGRIAFTADRDAPLQYEIYLMNADGSDQHNLTQRANANDYRPVSSPDGRQIAFDSWDDTGNRDIYLMDADGSHLYNLTQDPGEDLGPSWSPDGRQIAFLSARDGSSGIYVINTDGTNLRRLTFEDADREPIWSPGNARN